MTEASQEDFSAQERLLEDAKRGRVSDFTCHEQRDEESRSEKSQGDARGPVAGEAIRRIILMPDLTIDPLGLRIKSARIIGDLNLDFAVVSHGLEFEDCEFENTPSFVGTTIGRLALIHSELPGLSLTGIRTSETLNLSGIQTQGTVEADRAKIEGHLLLSHARLTAISGPAISLDRADISGSALLNKMHVKGETRALGIKVGGQLLMRRSRFLNPKSDALSLDGCRVTGGVVLDGIRTEGSVRALEANTGGQLSVEGAMLNAPHGVALYFDWIRIKGSLLMSGASAIGEVRMLGGRIEGEFSAVGAHLVNSPIALNMEGLEVTGNIFLDNLRAEGEVWAPALRTPGQYSLVQSTLLNATDPALTLSRAQIGQLLLSEHKQITPSIDLSFASIGALSVGQTPPAKGLPALSSAQGWTIGTVSGFLLTDWRAAKAWLDTIDAIPHKSKATFAAHPWKEMARIYDQIGRPEYGRLLRFCAATRTTKRSPLVSKLLFRWPYAWTVGYGYYPAMVLVWLLLLWAAVCSLAFYKAEAFTPTSPTASTVTVTVDNKPVEVRVTGAGPQPDSYPAFDARLYALDMTLPSAATGQTSTWQITGSRILPVVFALAKAASWLLAALLLAGVTGLLRKD